MKTSLTTFEDFTNAMYLAWQDTQRYLRQAIPAGQANAWLHRLELNFLFTEVLSPMLPTPLPELTEDAWMSLCQKQKDTIVMRIYAALDEMLNTAAA